MIAYWALVECDFQERYHIDLNGCLLDRRTARWFKVRLSGLLAVESRIQRALFPPEEN